MNKNIWLIIFVFFLPQFKKTKWRRGKTNEKAKKQLDWKAFDVIMFYSGNRRKKKLPIYFWETSRILLDKIRKGEKMFPLFAVRDIINPSQQPWNNSGGDKEHKHIRASVERSVMSQAWEEWE